MELRWRVVAAGASGGIVVLDLMSEAEFDIVKKIAEPVVDPVRGAGNA